MVKFFMALSRLCKQVLSISALTIILSFYNNCSRGFNVLTEPSVGENSAELLPEEQQGNSDAGSETPLPPPVSAENPSLPQIPFVPSTGGEDLPLEVCPVNRVSANARASALLSIVRGMPENSWVQINQNTFSSVMQSSEFIPDVCKNQSGPTAIINAWGGFAYDPNRSDLIIFGGGHADYCGNDIYRFRLSTLRWERAGLSSKMSIYGLSPGLVTAVPVDGLDYAPQTSHTYDHLTFMAAADRMIYFGGRPFWDGTAALYSLPTHPSTGPWLFNPDKSDANKVVGANGSAMIGSVPGGYMWENRKYLSQHANAFVPPNYGIPSSSHALCVHGHDVVFMRASSRYSDSSVLIRYHVPDVAASSQDALYQISSFASLGSEGDMSVDPFKKIAVLLGDSAQRPFAFWSLKTQGPQNNIVFLSDLQILNGTFTYDRNWGMDFDNIRRRFLLWHGDNSDVWELIPPATATVTPNGWVLRKISTLSGPQLSVWPSGGALGKWKYAPDLDLFVGMRPAPGGDIWVYKPKQWSDPGIN